MSKMFDFDGHSYADAFAENGYVHIPEGLPEDFHARLIHRRHNRDWSELFGLVLYGQPRATPYRS
jgi:hypothetical protein